jgi:uncharacterized protein (TIGR04255 family)
LEALSEYIDPKVVDRLGIRYIDRVTGPSLANIAKLVRPEVLGMLATPAAKNLSHTLSESVFSLSEINAQLLVRTGQIPAQGVVDPSAIEPINEPSWLLDVDIFRVSQVPFDCKQIVADTRSYAERTYAFFRWAVTDEFLKLYGGNT